MGQRLLARSKPLALGNGAGSGDIRAIFFRRLRRTLPGPLGLPRGTRPILRETLQLLAARLRSACVVARSLCRIVSQRISSGSPHAIIDCYGGTLAEALKFLILKRRARHWSRPNSLGKHVASLRRSATLCAFLLYPLPLIAGVTLHADGSSHTRNRPGGSIR